MLKVVVVTKIAPRISGKPPLKVYLGQPLKATLSPPHWEVTGLDQHLEGRGAWGLVHFIQLTAIALSAQGVS